jgi:hypothetical protein
VIVEPNEQLVAVALTGAPFIAAAFVVVRYVEPAIQVPRRRLLAGPWALPARHTEPS